MSEVLITARAVDRTHGDRQVLKNVQMTVHAGARVALGGPNGSGKSTLLRLLAGADEPTAGEITRVGGVRVGYLPQVDAPREDRTVREELTGRTGVARARDRMKRETERLAGGDLTRIQAQIDAVEEWTNLGGEDLDARLGAALDAVGLSPAWAGRRLSSLSGGQLARVNLATLRLARTDVVLLDEPGNHLDREGLELLRSLLEQAPAVVLASHDRSLLEDFAHEVVELDRGQARHFRGGWSSYMREKEAARERARSAWQEATAEKKRLIALERRIRERATVGERKARRSSESDKFIRHMAVESAQKNTAASGIAKRIEATEVPEKPWEENLSQLLLGVAHRVHTPRVLVARRAVAGAGTWRSAPIDLDLAPGERILLTGPNGSGKSSLIAMLAGRLHPVAGSVKVPSSVRVLELAQQGSVFGHGSGNLAERFAELADLDPTGARSALAAMKLGADQAGREPASLSPGELTRAELALLATRGAACLLLDEPGNHLDIEALEVLERSLEGWGGALVVASHDRAFTEAIRFDRTLDLGRRAAGLARPG